MKKHFLHIILISIILGLIVFIVIDKSKTKTPSNQNMQNNTQADKHSGETDVKKENDTLKTIEFTTICKSRGGEYAIGYSDLGDVMYCMGSKVPTRKPNGELTYMNEVKFIIQTPQAQEWCSNKYPGSKITDVKNRPIGEDGLSSQRCLVQK